MIHSFKIFASIFEKCGMLHCISQSMYPRTYAIVSTKTPDEQPQVVWSRLTTNHNQHLGLNSYSNVFIPDYRILLQPQANYINQYFKYCSLIQPQSQINFGRASFDATYFSGQPIEKSFICGAIRQPFPTTFKPATGQLRSYKTSSSPAEELTNAEVRRPCSADSGFHSSDDCSEASVKERIRQVILDQIHSNSEPESSGTDRKVDNKVNRNICPTPAELKQNIRQAIDTSGDNYKADQKKISNIIHEQASTFDFSLTHSDNSELLGNSKQSTETDRKTEHNLQHIHDHHHFPTGDKSDMYGNSQYFKHMPNMSRGRGHGHNPGFDQRFAKGYNNGKRGKRPSDFKVHNYEAKKARGPVWESRAVDATPSQISTYNTNAQMNQGIMKYFVENHQNDDLFRMKLELRDVLHAVFHEAFPDSGLYIVGSSMTGFSTLTSDMDLCLMVSDEEIERKDAIQILTLARQAFHSCSFLYNIFVIPAKVPILRFQDRISNVECDLNINNDVGIRNTHLLKYYASVDWRLRPLMLFIKKWARFHDINDANKQTLSSYSLSLMCIHYLQCACRPAVLPSLQKLHPTFFSEDVDVRNLRLDQMIDFKSPNTSQVGDLFLGFLKYYAEDFDYSNDVVSVRLGTKIPYHLCEMSKNSKDANKCIWIEEPFDLSNTARSCYDANVFSRVRRVFVRSYRKLAQTRNLGSLFNCPF